MTHLSDFSYLERCTIWVYISVFFGYSIYISDRFKCLRFRTIASGELKSIVTIIIIIMILMQFMWDIASTYVKYEEGFMLYENKIISTPFAAWTPKHQTLMMAMDYVECITFSLQTGALFLMQSFWNYLSNTYARKSFMGSLEFKFYILWALASMAMFPILQWVYRNDVNKREGIPQLAYGCEAMVAALLGCRSHFRFKRIISLSDKNNGASNKQIVNRLSYFKDMNMMITIVLFFYASSFIIICSDGLTDKTIINTNKFAMDTIIANVNICTVFILLLLISIFHPRPQYGRESDTSMQEVTKATTTTNGRVNNYIQSDSMRKPHEINTTKYNVGTAITSPTANNTGGFMRAMSPVTVDYPTSLTNDTEPLTHNTRRPLSPSDSYNNSKLAIEDPYNNEQVMFSMMKQQQQYGLPASPTGIHRSVSPRYDDYTDMSYHEQQTRATLNNEGDEIVRDWLWQSPDRRI